MEFRLEVVVYIPLGRTAKIYGTNAFVNKGAKGLDKDEMALFASGAEEVTDKFFRTYKKILDKALIQAKGDLNKDSLYRVITYKHTGSLIV